MTETAVRAAFRVQADWCRRLDGGFTARLCERLGERLDDRLDDASATGAAVLGWAGDPVADVLALRLTGGLNALVRAGALPALAACYPPHAGPTDAALDAALVDALHHPLLPPWLLSAPQTNEVARAAVLMPGLMTVAAATGLPLRLLELGASAGLNLRLDAYRYSLGEAVFDPEPSAALQPVLTLQPSWSGATPALTLPRIIARRGVDLAPVDLRDAHARDRLTAYVWPEHGVRLARLEAAIAAFVLDPVEVDRADAAGWVEAHVQPQAGAATVVYHSIAWQYFPAATKARITAHMAAAGAAATAAAPLCWLRFEFDAPALDGALPTLRLRSWPGDTDQLLARAHPHGAAIEWLA